MTTKSQVNYEQQPDDGCPANYDAQIFSVRNNLGTHQILCEGVFSLPRNDRRNKVNHFV